MSAPEETDILLTCSAVCLSAKVNVPPSVAFSEVASVPAPSKLKLRAPLIVAESKINFPFPAAAMFPAIVAFLMLASASEIFKFPFSVPASDSEKVAPSVALTFAVNAVLLTSSTEVPSTRTLPVKFAEAVLNFRFPPSPTVKVSPESAASPVIS